MRKPTISAQWCRSTARQLQIDAEDNLPTWAILGQVDRYLENQEKAAVLIRAAAIKNSGERREFLRGKGIEA